MINYASTYWPWMFRLGAVWARQTERMLRLSSASLIPPPSSFFQRRQSEEQQQKMEERQENLITTVTHELRTPLTSIRALSGILYDNPDLDVTSREKFLDIIVKESERLTGIINEVLELTELELGLVDWHLDEVDLKGVIQEALDAVADMSRQKSVRVELRLPPEIPTVLADPDRVTEVLVSLLSNAITFCDDAAGWVGVRLYVLEGRLRVDVCDNGPGLITTRRPSLIDTASNGEAPPAWYGPTSLGLLISRDIVAQLGGQLWVDESLSHGATFSFSLPLAGK